MIKISGVIIVDKELWEYKFILTLPSGKIIYEKEFETDIETFNKVFTKITFYFSCKKNAGNEEFTFVKTTNMPLYIPDIEALLSSERQRRFELN